VNEQEHQLPPQARAALDDYFFKIRLARATELAQSKRFIEAEAVLSPKGELTDNPCELDLLARIAAQQEQFAKARRLTGNRPLEEWGKLPGEAPTPEPFSTSSCIMLKSSPLPAKVIVSRRCLW
jgi:hypothetical protein